jgi:protein-disulfide isomerase
MATSHRVALAPGRSLVRLGSTVASLALALSLGMSTGAMAAAQETAEPELTWAPLVTLPPIAEPPFMTPVGTADGFRLGAADAPVAIEVWEDFQCPFCQRFAFEIKPELVARYVETGQATLTFRQLPFLGDESHWAAVAASLAAEQDRFWPFHDYLFANLLGENVGSYGLERLLAMGEAAGLDMEAFKAGLVLDQARARFAEIEAEARRDATALGISATPTVTVDGVPLQSPDFETVSAAVEAALVSTAASPSPSAATPTDEATGADD